MAKSKPLTKARAPINETPSPLDARDDSDLLTPIEARHYLRISREGLQRAFRRGDLTRVVLTARCIRIRVGDLRAYIKRVTQGEAA